jgi:DNA-binding transcriptional regulator YhcF (GntR family)
MLWSVDTRGAEALHEQIARCVRSALADGSLTPGERLPPASELAATLDVHTNTVLRAYRALRSDGLVEFRRGRGVRVTPDAAPREAVLEAVRHLVDLGRSCGLSTSTLARLVEELG